jgi:hypothetical protein
VRVHLTGRECHGNAWRTVSVEAGFGGRGEAVARSLTVEAADGEAPVCRGLAPGIGSMHWMILPVRYALWTHGVL